MWDVPILFFAYMHHDKGWFLSRSGECRKGCVGTLVSVYFVCIGMLINLEIPPKP